MILNKCISMIVLFLCTYNIVCAKTCTIVYICIRSMSSFNFETLLSELITANNCQ